MSYTQLHPIYPRSTGLVVFKNQEAKNVSAHLTTRSQTQSLLLHVVLHSILERSRSEVNA